MKFIKFVENVDFIIHGGDVFDRPDLSPNVVGQFAKIFRMAHMPIYAISGNHDTFGHNPNGGDVIGQAQTGKA